jgi:hypothetical protein
LFLGQIIVCFFKPWLLIQGEEESFFHFKSPKSYKLFFWEGVATFMPTSCNFKSKKNNVANLKKIV